jgi:hypothetical protein
MKIITQSATVACTPSSSLLKLVNSYYNLSILKISSGFHERKLNNSKSFFCTSGIMSYL